MGQRQSNGQFMILDNLSQCKIHVFFKTHGKLQRKILEPNIFDCIDFNICFLQYPESFEKKKFVFDAGTLMKQQSEKLSGIINWPL